MRHAYSKYKDIEIQENTIFAKILKFVINTFNDKKDRQDRLLNIQYHHQNNDDSNMIRSSRNYIFFKIFEYVEKRFIDIKKKNIIKFLFFIDSYLSEEIWFEKIKEIIVNTFKNIYENNFNQRYAIFQTKITNNNFGQHLQNYNEIFDIFLQKCISEFNKLRNKKEYNEKTGLNSLEHLFMDLNSEEITEDIANHTISYMIYYNLITKDGIINEKLFEDCFIKIEKNNVVKLHQTFRINIINSNNQKESVNISNLKQFIIKDLSIPMVDSSFVDLSNFYSINNYNVQEQLEKDYSLYIINNFKEIIRNMLLMNDSVFESYYKILLNLIKSLIRNLLQERIFKSENQRSFENIISNNLSNEEREEFNKIIKEAGEKAIKIIKKD